MKTEFRVVSSALSYSSVKGTFETYEEAESYIESLPASKDEENPHVLEIKKVYVK